MYDNGIDANELNPGPTQDEMEAPIESVDISGEELHKKLKKLKKKIGHDVAEEIDNMDVSDLKRRIVRSQVNIADTKAAMERDEELAQAKETLKQMKGPYSDAKSSQMAVAEYATLRLKEKT